MTFYLIFYLVVAASALGMLMFNYLQGYQHGRFVPYWMSAAFCFVPVVQGISWGMELSILLKGLETESKPKTQD